MHTRKNRITRFALAVAALALILSPLASCQGSGGNSEGPFGKPEALISTGSDAKTFSFLAVGQDGLYYGIEDSKDDSNTFWKAGMNGANATALDFGKYEPNTYYFKAFGNRLYYTSQSPRALCSSKTDGTGVVVLDEEHVDSYYNDPLVTAEWIYFIRMDIIDMRHLVTVSGLYRVKPDGSSLEEIASLGDYNYYYYLTLIGSQLFYSHSLDSTGDGSIDVMAMRETQGGTETAISKGVHEEVFSVCEANGTLFFGSAFSGDHEGRSSTVWQICSLETKEPYTEARLVSGEYGEMLYPAFASKGWLYYEKKHWDMEQYYMLLSNELWRVRTDGTGAQCLIDNDRFTDFLAFDGTYVYYSAPSEDGSGSTMYRMKTP